MKKLMVAFAAIALAIGAQAAQWTWGISVGGPIYKPETSTGIASGTAYLYAFSSASAAESALTSFVESYAAETLTDSALTSASGYVDGSKRAISEGALSANYAMNNDPYSGISKGDTVYWAMVVDATEGLFVDYTSATRNADGKNRGVAFNEAGNSQNVFLASSGYQGAGFYTVPEPTSGLMLLLGFAGLALKRKRA